MLASHHGFGCELDTHIEEFSPLSTRQFSAGYGSGFEDGEKSELSLAFAIAIRVGSGLLAGAAGALCAGPPVAFVPFTPMSVTTQQLPFPSGEETGTIFSSTALPVAEHGMSVMVELETTLLAHFTPSTVTSYTDGSELWTETDVMSYFSPPGVESRRYSWPSTGLPEAPQRKESASPRRRSRQVEEGGEYGCSMHLMNSLDANWSAALLPSTPTYWRLRKSFVSSWRRTRLPSIGLSQSMRR